MSTIFKQAKVAPAGQAGKVKKALKAMTDAGDAVAGPDVQPGAKIGGRQDDKNPQRKFKRIADKVAGGDTYSRSKLG